MGKLTAKAITEAKPDPKRNRKLYDGNGLFVKILMSGTKTFIVRVRQTEKGRADKEREVTLGRFPKMSLTEARKEAAALVVPPELTVRTFREVADDFLRTRQRRLSANYTKKANARLEDLRAIFNRPIDAISRRELLEEIRKVEARTVHMAHRLCGWAKLIFDHAENCGELSAPNPRGLTKALTPTPPAKPRPAVTRERLTELLQAIDGYKQHPTVKAAVWLVFFTTLRASELTNARWDWLRGDVLTIPGDVMKIKDKPHRVPLCRQAMELIEGLRALNGDTPFIFASPDRTRAPITPNAVLNTFRRTGFAGVQTTHGVRTIFSTLINETREEGLHSFSSDLVELQIAHALPKVRAAYMRSDYLEPRRVMLQWFADYLDALKA